ncbi:putative sulfate permease [Cladophialophora carrionii]|uniref:Putative sulfate permease n=1 Tax=Cladophialophora carrionii TaxID=86049 RepID=A0A1C1CP22_9EURO|nr:putative sulfate permease [Cladophialophora carrionii]
MASKVVNNVKTSLQTDVNWKQARRLAGVGFRRAPSAAATYLVEKVPIVGWLPRYNYRWLINDFIAGLTIGIMLVPQGLAYAKIATIPVQYGLMASWFPGILYAFMGTSKDLSTGPTSLIGLLTAEIVKDLVKEGYQAQEVAAAVALGMGIYGMALGFLKLGFLLDFVSTPVLNGFISAAAIVIALGQGASLLGEDGGSSETADEIHNIFSQLPDASGLTCAIGFTAIFILVALEQVGKRWGSKNRIAFYLSISRAFICVLLYTGVSYAVNQKKDEDDYLWAVAKVKSDGIQAKAVDSKLFSKVIGRSIAPFVAAALEHTAIARGFGLRNHYTPDISQELCYLGVANMVNSFWGAMGVGGAMSRTSVNSGCKVRSPLGGVITTAVVLITIYELTGALYWIPKTVLSAIVITAVWPLFGTWRTYYHYWRTSFTDFVAAMLTFWLTLFKSSEIGIGTGVGWSIAVCLVRQAFKHMNNVNSASTSELVQSIDESKRMPDHIPADTQIFTFAESMFFPNAQRFKTLILDVVKTHHAPFLMSPENIEAERTWSVVGEKRVAKLRREAGISNMSALPPLRLLILDFTKANHLDSTANLKLHELYNEVKKYSGDRVEIRFVGLNPYVRSRFERAEPGWSLVDASEQTASEAKSESEVAVAPKDPVVKVYRSCRDAMADARHEEPQEIVVDEKLPAEHYETV